MKAGASAITYLAEQTGTMSRLFNTTEFPGSTQLHTSLMPI